MDKDYLFDASKDKIRVAWQIPCVKAVTVTHGKDHVTDGHFGFSIDVAYQRHAPASFRWRQRVEARCFRTLFLPRNWFLLSIH
jgi:hypothetical protein